MCYTNLYFYATSRYFSVLYLHTILKNNGLHTNVCYSSIGHPEYMGGEECSGLSGSSKRLRWSRGSVLTFGTQVRGFAPGRSRRIFRSKKKSSACLPFGGEVKPSVPCRSFTACKRSLNVTWISAFRQNYRIFLAHSSTFRRWVL